jgi:hypothetical protein
MDGTVDTLGVDQQLAADSPVLGRGAFGGAGGFGVRYPGSGYAWQWCQNQCLNSPAAFTGLSSCAEQCLSNLAGAAANPLGPQTPL